MCILQALLGGPRGTFPAVTAFALAASLSVAQSTPGYFVAGAVVTAAPGLSSGPVADVDASGYPDVLLPQPGYAGFTVVLDPGVNDPPATLSFTFLPPGTTGPAVLHVGEFNGDGVPDLAGKVGTVLHVFLGTGPAAWNLDVNQAAVPSVSVPGELILVDVDVDGRDDVAFWQIGLPWMIDPLVAVHRNLWPAWVPGYSSALDMFSAPHFGDVTGDGWPDLVLDIPTASGFTRQLLTMAGTGDGHFVPIGSLYIDSVNVRRAIGDLDLDGHDDLVFVHSDLFFGGWIRVGWGSAAGLAAPVTVSETHYSVSGNVTAVLDVDRDGDQDIVRAGPFWASMSTPASNTIQVSRGAGSRTFAPDRMVFDTAIPNPQSWAWTAAIADLDGDADEDVFGFDFESMPGQILGRVFENRALRGPGCPGTGGLVPAIPIGNPTLGNPSFGIGLAAARPSSSAALGLSLAEVPTAPCAILIDLEPGNLLLPHGNAGIVDVDAGGEALIPAPLPSDPFWHGATVHAQWLVVDPEGGFTVGPYSSSLSPARRIVLW